MMKQNNAGILVGGALVVLGGLIAAAYIYKSRKARTIQVVVVDTERKTDLLPLLFIFIVFLSSIALDHISEPKLLTSLFEMACQSFASLSADKKVTEQQAATLYSLYKQKVSGDASEFE